MTGPISEDEAYDLEHVYGAVMCAHAHFIAIHLSDPTDLIHSCFGALCAAIEARLAPSKDEAA